MYQQVIGIDIIEISRISEAIARWGDRFLKRVYTDRELALFKGKPESLAVRFAGKEAAMKALNNNGMEIAWKEIEILPESNGRPILHIYGQAQKKARDLGLSSLTISMSHSRDNAIALVIGVR